MSAAQKACKSASGPGASALVNRRILLVEDEAFIAMELEDMLLDAGAEVVGPVANLQAALKAAEDEPIDAAILDIMLGQEEVFPAASVLQGRAVPFVFHSAHAEADALQAHYPGAALYSKPVDTQVLLNGLAKLFD